MYGWMIVQSNQHNHYYYYYYYYKSTNTNNTTFHTPSKLFLYQVVLYYFCIKSLSTILISSPSVLLRTTQHSVLLT